MIYRFFAGINVGWWQAGSKVLSLVVLFSILIGIYTFLVQIIPLILNHRPKPEKPLTKQNLGAVLFVGVATTQLILLIWVTDQVPIDALIEQGIPEGIIVINWPSLLIIPFSFLFLNYIIKPNSERIGSGIAGFSGAVVNVLMMILLPLVMVSADIGLTFRCNTEITKFCRFSIPIIGEKYTHFFFFATVAEGILLGLTYAVYSIPLKRSDVSYEDIDKWSTWSSLIISLVIGGGFAFSIPFFLESPVKPTYLFALGVSAAIPIALIALFLGLKMHYLSQEVGQPTAGRD